MPYINARTLVAISAMLAACGGDLTLPSDGGPGGAPSGGIAVADDGYSTLEGVERTLAVPAPGVLANDRVDGSASAELRADLVRGPEHGRLDLRADGSLAYTPESGWFGRDGFTYRATLPGGASADASVEVQVEPLNDSPLFTAGPDQEAKRLRGHDKGGDDDEEDDRREVVIEGWASDIRPGPANESDQSVAFLVEVTSGAESLAGTPSVTPEGTLRYTPSDHDGTARVEVRLRDDGGTANGGQDTSPAHTLIIVVEH